MTGASGYHVYRSDTAGGTFSKLTTTAVTSPAYTDTDTVAGVTWHYRVTALNADTVESAPSTTASAARLAPAPGIPSGLVATRHHHRDLPDLDRGDRRERVPRVPVGQPPVARSRS